MGNITGKDAKVLVDEYDLSGYFNQADTSQEAALLETTTYGATARTYLTGFKNGTMNLQGFWDGLAGAADVVLNAALGSAGGEVLTMAPEGLTVGKRLALLLSRLTKYGVSTPVDGVAAISAEMQADGGIDYGVSLHALTAETATGNGSSVDNGAASTNGGVAHLHVSAVTAVGGDSLTVKVQHSTDNSVWADLVTFTAVTTAATKQRVVVAAGTTVNRYLRASWTKGGAGSPSYTFAVGMARR